MRQHEQFDPTSAKPPRTLPKDSANLLNALDGGGVSRFHWKIMFVSGMGFFTDAYDLFIIGIAVSLIKPEWDLSTAQVSILSSATLIASAVGAIIFGRVADIVGRKRIYGYEVLVLVIGALASAFSPGFWPLFVSRIILGIGVGGDYPVSATIMSEYSGKASRGRMVSLVFAMQGAGLVLGPLIASAMLASGLSTDTTWRLLLGLGAVPGLAVFYLRRRIQETPREAAGPIKESTARQPQGALEGFGILLRNRRLVLWLVGTAGCWMVFDFAYYGNSISSPEVLALLNPHASLLTNTLLQLLIFAVFALPGYALSIWLLDKAGRKSIQVLGFGMMALAFGLIALVPSVATTVAPFVLLFGMSYLFSEFGPNTTTFVYPAEVFPVEVRTTGHGLAAAAGKVGAFIGAFLFPMMLASSMGIRGAEGVAAGVSLLGLLLTVVLLPEPKGRSLEELTEVAYAPPVALEAAA